MRVNSRIRINQGRMNRLTEEAKTALEQTAEALHTKVVQDGVVPRDKGNLQGEAFFVDSSQVPQGHVRLVHSAPYARRLYYHPEYNFHQEPWEETVHHRDGSTSHLKHDGNPNAKGQWFEDYTAGGRYENFAPDTFRRFYGRLIDN